MIPIAGVTNSDIHFFTWTQQFPRQLGREGFEDGWAFFQDQMDQGQRHQITKTTFFES
jgi:hypothetical protein